MKRRHRHLCPSPHPPYPRDHRRRPDERTPPPPTMETPPPPTEEPCEAQPSGSRDWMAVLDTTTTWKRLCCPPLRLGLFVGCLCSWSLQLVRALLHHRQRALARLRRQVLVLVHVAAVGARAHLPQTEADLRAALRRVAHTPPLRRRQGQRGAQEGEDGAAPRRRRVRPLPRRRPATTPRVPCATAPSRAAPRGPPRPGRCRRPIPA